MENKITEDNLYRLAIGIMEKYKVSYEEALTKLSSFNLLLNCGESIRDSKILQVSLITAVNTGKRAFLGGVYVIIPEKVEALFPWPGNKTLNEIVRELGATTAISDIDFSFVLNFGIPADINKNSLQVVCNAWQGGFLSSPEEIHLPANDSITIGGVLAAGLSVAVAFMRVSGISILAGEVSSGISLWRPDLHWLDKEAGGPSIKRVPKRYWVLGLGHLGQAYLWCLALLGINDPSQVEILLQDFDKITEANQSSGLLCEDNIKKYKTRVCSEWLENRHFITKITERMFDGNTIREGEEPFLALCGFDNSVARTFLENAKFDFIVECGLGNKLFNFDSIFLHTFPNASKTSAEIWGTGSGEETLNQTVLEEFKDKSEDCGILALTLAKKAVSASFVGAVAASLVIAEVLRSCDEGLRYEKIAVKLRDTNSINAITLKPFDTELVANGYIEI